MSPARKRKERHARAQRQIQREAAKDAARVRECLNIMPPWVELVELRDVTPTTYTDRWDLMPKSVGDTAYGRWDSGWRNL